MRIEVIADVMVIAGALAVVGGAAMWDPAAALVVGGVMAMAAGIRIGLSDVGRSSISRKPDREPEHSDH